MSLFLPSNVWSRKNSQSNYNLESPETLAEVKKKKKKKSRDAKKEEEEEESVDMLPVLGGVSVALVLGAPVYLVSNIKLALFASIGGGIMGYTTGKMFSDWG